MCLFFAWLLAARNITSVLLVSFLLQPFFVQAEEQLPNAAVEDQVTSTLVEELVIPETEEPEVVTSEEAEVDNEEVSAINSDTAIKEVVSDAQSEPEPESESGGMSAEVGTSSEVVIVGGQANVVIESASSSVEAEVATTTTTAGGAATTTETSNDSAEQADQSTGNSSVNATSTSESPTASTSDDDGIEAGSGAVADVVTDEATNPISDTIDEVTATTTTDQATSTTATDTEPTVVAVVHTDSAFSFNQSECTLVDDGSYYCQRAPEVPILADDLFAAPDQDGDMEIFIRRNGEEVQLTNNVVDDASPFYDSVSDTVVWHRLETDRYQIIQYDMDTDEETQLTDTPVNNMEPTRSGRYIVWQRWVKNNWEIVLYDAETAAETVLTETIAHDIAPHVRGDLVIWNVRHRDGTHQLRTYEISSGLYNEIADPDGVSVSNPRMVVVYDAEYQNGDTITKGFDLVTGEIVPLERSPRDLPESLPDPESTGETRALVAPTVAKPEHDESDSDDDTEPSVTGDPDTLNLASTTLADVAESAVDELSDAEYELDLSVASTTDTTDEAVTEFDLVLLASTTAATSTQSDQ